MRVITIKQPFATLIAEGLKEYEFRTWRTYYRGELFIHAGKSIDKEAMERFKNLDLEYPKGCIIAKVTLTDCVPVGEKLKNELRKKNLKIYWGTTEAEDWVGFGFKLENIQKIDPIYVNGKLGLWEYP